MSRATTHRSGDVAFNGKLLYVIGSGATASSATVRFGHFVAPCDGTIVQLNVNVVTVATHATNDISFGIMSDIDSHLNEVDMTDVAAGNTNYVGHANILSVTITAGEAYAWGWAGGDTTGQFTCSVVVEPR
jgi:hypothetical protein